jgi:HEPN domain-containing protein
MTESIEHTELLKIYNKFIKMRESMAIANEKYRNSDNGKEKMKMLHKRWFQEHKNNPEYKKQVNAKARERYHIRKAEKLLKNTEKDICFVESLGIIEI